MVYVLEMCKRNLFFSYIQCNEAQGSLVQWKKICSLNSEMMWVILNMPRCWIFFSFSKLITFSCKFPPVQIPKQLTKSGSHSHLPTTYYTCQQAMNSSQWKKSLQWKFIAMKRENSSHLLVAKKIWRISPKIRKST